MRHILINPTWRCQLISGQDTPGKAWKAACGYCWLPYSGIHRDAPEHTGHEWAEALLWACGPGDVVDICGGEPTLWDGLPVLTHALAEKGLRWALTTNAMRPEVLEELPVAGCVCLNVSLHRGNRKYWQQIDSLRRRGFFVNANIVKHAAAPSEGQGNRLTFQDWKGNKPTDGKRRLCNAGKYHWAADPAGDLWRCSVHLELGQQSIGNLFTRQVTPLDSPLCVTGCTSCYTENPAAWGVTMTEEVTG